MIDKWIELPIKQLVKADWNYKKDDNEKKEKLKANIKRNGQIENIIVRILESGFYEVVNGNHRYDAFRELGTEKVICYNLGIITQQQAIRIAIETNETKFDTDQILLAERIKELSEIFDINDLVSTMPYSEQDIENYNKLLDFDWSQYDKEKFDIDYKNGRFIVSIESDNLDKMNMWLQEKGIDYVLQEGQNNLSIKI